MLGNRTFSREISPKITNMHNDYIMISKKRVGVKDTKLESAAAGCTSLARRMKTPNSFIHCFCFFVYLVINRYQLFKNNLLSILALMVNSHNESASYRREKDLSVVYYFM